ncbi:hypothetical protein [Micromonospora humidisoli]|uniref:Uncharacterized protein n=1 Tax=Micromonospora humidisoli TaxID=2807622 RepID=A0ABS2JDA2_9ACTN|nr:hypothetical protein [Micromonospora humidisoli]MBM7083551.1 hypothetical protein [Micromonospora humidisoli]
MTSPTQPGRQVEDDLTRQGYPENEPTARGQSEDIEAEAEIKVGFFQGKVRLRDGAGRTSVSFSHLVDAFTVMIWPVGVALLLLLVDAPALIKVWGSSAAFVLALTVFVVRMWLAGRQR